MISISKEANLNYLAKLVKLNNIKKHQGADKLQIAIIDFQQIVTGMDAKVGDLYVYFPLECVINQDYLSHTNSFRHSHLNRVVDDEHCGFFEDKGRVKAVKLRGEASNGYIVPAATVEEFTGYKFKEDDIDKEFDTIKDILMLKKYVIVTRQTGLGNNKLGKAPKISRLVDKQVHLHVDTEQLRKNVYKFNLDDEISITYKLHGTSGWVSHVLVKRKLKLYEKIIRRIGVKIKDTEYDYVYGSRKVVKNEFETPSYKGEKQHFYEYDLWGEVKEELKDKCPKGYSLYYEIVGYTKNGAEIQKDYDYGCKEGEKKVYIYRITFTNEDGVVNNLSTKQTVEFCNHFNLNYVPLFYVGNVQKFIELRMEDTSCVERWQEIFIKKLENNYTEKDCFMCTKKTPEEGIVVRKESMFQFEAYKLKSFRFLQHETELMDAGVEDLESNN